MKKILYILLLFPVLVLGQTSALNYVRTYIYTEATTTSDASKAQTSVTYYDGLGRPIQQVAGKMSAAGKDLITPIAYDAFGRQNKDYLPYEASTTDLSFDSAAETNVLTFYNKTAFENTANPYSEKFFEPSPLNRIVKQGAPGNIWKGNEQDDNDHTIKYAYLSNRSEETIKRFVANTSWNAVTKTYDISLVEDGTYSVGKLYKTIIKDENRTGPIIPSLSWSPGQTDEYKDFEGRVILKKTYYASADRFGMPTQAFVSTYYVYDHYGNLTYVLPSALAPDTSQTYLDAYCYQYKYDSRNRLAEKKLPGKDWEYIVYDNLDRPVATGPAYSPFGSTGNTQKGWLITKYDAFGRVAYSGWYAATDFSSSGRNTMQGKSYAIETKTTSGTTIDNISVYYTNTSFPTTGLKLLTVNYYDNYTFPSAATFPSGGVEGTAVLSNAKGLNTGSWKRILTIATETFGEVSTTFYDSKNRSLRSRTTNSQLGGYIQIDSKLTFDGKPVYAITRHKRTSSSSEQEVVVRNDYTYTAQERLLSETHTIGSLTAELMSYNTYDAIGQLKQKKVGRSQSSPLQNVDFAYNIRGWLKGINNVSNLSSGSIVIGGGGAQDLFAFKVNYTDESEFAPVQANYNGNITETSWRTSSDNIMRRYSYKYDDLSRLSDAYYQMPGAVVPMRNSYDEHLKYDTFGNIVKLQRNGGLDDENSVEVDDLTYFYTGHRLDKIVDATNSPQGFNDKTDPSVDDFGYDSFGNLTSDINKGITANNIIYNHLNLPIKININTGLLSGTISYIYNTDGVKVKKTVNNTSITPAKVVTTDYLGGFQYTNSVLDFFSTSEGYVKNTVVNGSNNFNYVYHYRDHLGNIRLSYMVDPADNKVKILKESHYYPFGLEHQGYSSDQLMVQPSGPIFTFPVSLTPVIDAEDVTYKYKFQGQERQEDLGLNWNSFKWRNYDDAIGRFMNVDPLSEKFYYNSPYAFSENKVISHFELEGLESVLAITLGKEVEYRGNILKRANPNVINENIENVGISEFVSALKTASSSDPKGIGFVAVWGHGWAGAMRGESGRIRTSDLNEVNEAIKNGDIKFAENAMIYLGPCNLGSKDGPYSSFAEVLSKITGVKVVAGNDSVGPIKENIGEMSYSVWDPSTRSFVLFDNGKETLIGPKVDAISLMNRALNPVACVSCKMQQMGVNTRTTTPTATTLNMNANPVGFGKNEFGKMVPIYNTDNNFNRIN
jgi:RHS repeat-associated protein